MIITNWDISLIEFVCKFCNSARNLKIKFTAFDDALQDRVVKTLIINQENYIPDALRQIEVHNLDADGDYIVIRLRKGVNSNVLNDMKHRGYKLGLDEEANMLIDNTKLID